MSLSLRTRKAGDVVIVDLSGRLVSGEPVLLLRETVRQYCTAAKPRFVLNLNHVSYIDSSGLGELVKAYATIRKSQGTVSLLNLTSRVRDLLQMTKLLTVFDSFEDEADAVRSVEPVSHLQVPAATLLALASACSAREESGDRQDRRAASRF